MERPLFTTYVEPEAGETIERYVDRLLSVAKISNVSGSLNGYDIKLEKGTKKTKEAIIAEFDDFSERSAKKFYESPEGVKLSEKNKEDQHRVDKMLSDLEDSDTIDTLKLISWIDGFTKFASMEHVTYDKQRVVNMLKKFGFEPPVELNDSLIIGDDKDLAARKIIDYFFRLNDEGKNLSRAFMMHLKDYKEKFQDQ